MSISDMIVVMKDGAVQQIGKPQEVYDNPINLFVAKFLGTPPINVFEGEVRDESLFLSGKSVMPAPGVRNGKVYVAIRPEGFVPDENGALECKMKAVEVMGRDVSVVCAHPAFVGTTLRAIIDADDRGKVNGENVRFRLKPHKTLLFDRETERRLGEDL